MTSPLTSPPPTMRSFSFHVYLARCSWFNQKRNGWRYRECFNSFDTDCISWSNTILWAYAFTWFCGISFPEHAWSRVSDGVRRTSMLWEQEWVLCVTSPLKCNNFLSVCYSFIAMTKAAMDNATAAMAVELAKHKVCLLVHLLNCKNCCV